MTLTLMNLRTEAEKEARRVASARAVIQQGDQEALVQLEGDTAWIAFARRQLLRRALAGRICLVWRVAFEDRSGRLVYARLVPILAHVRRNAQIRTLLRDAEDVLRDRVEAAADEWAESAIAAARAFAEARCARQEAIARLPQRPHAPSQPGLFDRRTERAHQAQAAIDDDAEEAAVSRLQSIGETAAVVRQPARLLLVLLA
jgi:hypothetical protein